MKRPPYHITAIIACTILLLLVTERWLLSCFASSASTADPNSLIGRSRITEDGESAVLSSLSIEGGTRIEYNSSVENPPVNATGYEHSAAKAFEDDIDNEGSSIIANFSDSTWRQTLPASLQNRTTLYKLNIDGCSVYLLGTSHVSNTSCHDVQILINEVQPEGLFLELCGQRLAILSPPPQLSTPSSPPEENSKQQTRRSFFPFFGRQRNKKKQKKAKLSEIVQNIKQQHPEMSHASATSSALLTKIQTDYATKLNITIGAEFREAYEAAQQLNRQKKQQKLPSQHSWPYNGYYPPINDYNPYCRVILGDRPVRLTLVRCWESLRWWGKIKLVLGLLWSSLFQPSSQEIIEWMESIMNGGTDLLTKSIDELRDNFPTIARTIIEERDAYMFCKLVQMVDIFRQKNNVESNYSNNNTGIQTLVAVVGAGHCPGICRWVELYNNKTQLTALEQKFLTNEIIEGKENSERQNPYIIGNRTIEDLIKSLIETKKNRCETNEEMEELLTQVVELHSA